MFCTLLKWLKTRTSENRLIKLDASHRQRFPIFSPDKPCGRVIPIGLGDKTKSVRSQVPRVFRGIPLHHRMIEQLVVRTRYVRRNTKTVLCNFSFFSYHADLFYLALTQVILKITNFILEPTSYRKVGLITSVENQRNSSVFTWIQEDTQWITTPNWFHNGTANIFTEHMVNLKC